MYPLQPPASPPVHRIPKQIPKCVVRATTVKSGSEICDKFLGNLWAFHIKSRTAKLRRNSTSPCSDQHLTNLQLVHTYPSHWTVAKYKSLTFHRPIDILLKFSVSHNRVILLLNLDPDCRNYL
jgi:hypothetical protein